MARRRVMGSICVSLISIMVIAFAYLPIRIMRNASADGSRVARSHEVRKEIRDISEALRSVINEHRNYLHARGESARLQRSSEINRLLAEISEVKQLVQDNPTQLSHLNQLIRLVETHFFPPLWAEVYALTPTLGVALDPKGLDEVELMSPLLEILRAMDHEESYLLQMRKARLQETTTNDSYLAIAMGVASTFLLTGLYTLYRNDAREKERHAEVLRLANIEVEKANQMKSDFLAKMSHEIRTPLAAIIGFADLLSAPDLKESERLRNVDVIRRNGRALGQIIDDILDLSKVEAGKISIEHIAFDLSELLSDIFFLFTKKAKEKGVGFSIESSGSMPETLISDPTRIRQILINMVSNALKFTHEGNVRVFVEWDSPNPAAPSEGTLTFTIRDTGVGITEEQKEKIFQPFAQAEHSTARQFGGTGLGLVLSRQLANLLGGGVDLTASKAGEGSTFLVSIKATTPSKEVTAVPHFLLTENNMEAKSEDTSCELLGIRILLAEDAPDNQLLITQILESCGAEVVVVDNGRDAVNRALTEDHDLILMDVQMPILGGHEASLELRARGYVKPIVALTAHAMVEERQRSNEIGYNDYLTKPVDSLKLIQTIRNHTRYPSEELSRATLHSVPSDPLFDIQA